MQIKSKAIMSWILQKKKKKEGIFCTVNFVQRKNVCFTLMFSVLNTVSECTYFYIYITSYTILLVFKIVQNLQCILKQLFGKGVNVKRFLKKCLCYDVLIFFSSQHDLERHIVWYIKSRTCLFTSLSSFSRFSENWHALSHEQYFSKNHFLDYLEMCL